MSNPPGRDDTSPTRGGEELAHLGVESLLARDGLGDDLADERREPLPRVGEPVVDRALRDAVAESEVGVARALARREVVSLEEREVGGPALPLVGDAEAA